ncbi:MAG: hypothetical protein HQM15_06255 [Deltaproteobacteria bacterium]|nr:hypothetical protein [Deltaproteobacteria bacterium]
MKNKKILLSLCLLLTLSFANSGCKRLRHLFTHKKETKQEVPKQTPMDAQSPTKPSEPPPQAGTVQTPMQMPPISPINPAQNSLGLQNPPPPPDNLEASPPVNTTQNTAESAVALPEVGGAISVFAGNPKSVAEGSLFLVEDAQASSVSGKTLRYQWSVSQGSVEKMKVIEGTSLQGVFKVGDVSEMSTFSLKLTASDGSAQSSSELKVTVFPAKLARVQHLGGMARKIESLENQIFISRGRTIEVYDAGLNLVKKIDLDSPILEISAFAASGKKYLYSLSEAGDWSLVDVNDLENPQISLVQKVGSFLKNIHVSSFSGELWATTTERDSATLWNLKDVAHPQAKFVFKGPYQGVQKILLSGKNVYLVDTKAIHTLDASTGILQASIPLSGKVNHLDVVSLKNKNYLLLALGNTTDTAVRSEAGLRLFEIGASGRLLAEKRFNLKGNLPVLQFVAVQNAQFILGVQEGQNVNLKAFDLEKGIEFPLIVPTDLKLARLQDLFVQASAKETDLLLTDGASFKRLKMVTSAASIKLDALQSSYSVIFAGSMKLNGENLLMSDFGSGMDAVLPAFYEISTQDFSKLNPLVLNAPAYFSDFVTLPTSKQSLGILLSAEAPAKTAESLSAESQAESQKQSNETLNIEGSLALFANGVKPLKISEKSLTHFGLSQEQAASRAFALGYYKSDTQFILGIAVGKTLGAGLKTGLYLLKFNSEQELLASLKEDLSKKMTQIPLSDARDVRFSKDGKWALVAAGSEGLVLIDLEKNQVSLKNNPFQGLLADRVQISHDQQKVFVSFLSPSLGQTPPQSKLQIYSYDQGKLGQWGGIEGLSGVTLPYAQRSGNFALSEDDLFLFIANGSQGLSVYNVSDAAAPVLIEHLATFGMTADVVVGEKFKKIYMADLVNGLEVAEFGF